MDGDNCYEVKNAIRLKEEFGCVWRAVMGRTLDRVADVGLWRRRHMLR